MGVPRGFDTPLLSEHLGDYRTKMNVFPPLHAISRVSRSFLDFMILTQNGALSALQFLLPDHVTTFLHYTVTALGLHLHRENGCSCTQHSTQGREQVPIG